MYTAGMTLDAGMKIHAYCLNEQLVLFSKFNESHVKS